MGLMGDWPDQIDPAQIAPRIAALRDSGQLLLDGNPRASERCSPSPQYPISLADGHPLPSQRKASAGYSTVHDGDEER
jgi:hypothetical protein